MPQLSPTTLKLFQECPRCFWRHCRQRIERPRGPFPSLPGGIDRVLKTYFEEYRRQGTLPPLVRGQVEGRLSTTPLTLGFTDERLQVRLWGKLDDCLVLPDGRLTPLDHKTRASAPADVTYTQQYYQLQMDVYTLLLERAGHAVSRTAYVVYYFPVAGSLHDGFPFQVAVHHIATHPDAAYELFCAACRCLEQPKPASGPACEYCRWAATIEAAPAARAGAFPEDLFA